MLQTWLRLGHHFLTCTFLNFLFSVVQYRVNHFRAISLVLLLFLTVSSVIQRHHQLSAGADHLLCLTSSFSVLTLGSNTCHQLTLKARKNEEQVFDSVEPVVVNMPNALLVPVQVCCGAASSHVLTSDGSVVGWGLNDCGQIGSGYVGNGLTEGLRKNTRLQHVPTLSPYFGPNRGGEAEKQVHPISAMIKKLLYNAKKDARSNNNQR